MQKSSRIQSIDFWRGAVLVVIFIDHVPGNLLGYLTPRNFGFSDAAEAFVFVSGLVLGYINWPRIRQGRIGDVTRRCLKRAGQLYLVQVGLSLTAVILFGLAFVAGAGDEMIAADNRAFFFQHPGGGLLGFLLLSYQFGYFNILSVYVVLMVMAAGLFFLLSRNVALAFSLSALVYAASRFGLMLPSWPVPYTWFLNPFAWQLLFMLGIGIGALRRNGPLPRSPLLFAIASAYLVFGLGVSTGLFGLRPDLGAVLWPILDTNKGILGWTRLLHFLSLAYVVSQIRLGDWLLERVPGAGLVSELGRHSLTVFAAGSVLSAIGQVAVRLAPEPAENAPVAYAVGIIVVLIGVAVMMALARFMSWREDLAHQPATNGERGYAGAK
jgi:hypothetical protein